MRVELGNVPDHEPCDFISAKDAKEAAEAYIRCIEKFCGKPPLGSKFSVEKDDSGWFSVVYCAASDNETQEYANHIINYHPLTFSGAGSLHI